MRGHAAGYLLLFVVAVKPRFKVKPLNTTAYEGYPVMLHCVAIGEPTPKIQWDKNSFSHIDQRRFKVRPLVLVLDLYSKRPILELTQKWFISKLSLSMLECGVHDRLQIYPLPYVYTHGIHQSSSSFTSPGLETRWKGPTAYSVTSIYWVNTFPVFLPLSQS